MDSEEPLLPGEARPRSKPSDLYIHPNLSNVARADAVATELGLSGNTDRVPRYQ